MNLAHNGYIYCEIWKGMYGLPQADILANQQLVQRLEPKGYAPCKHKPVLWRQTWIPIALLLVVDYFGVKYVVKQHEYHLINTIQEHYKVLTNWQVK